MQHAMFYVVFPYYWAMISSTKSGPALYEFSLLPSFDFSNYVALFTNRVFMRSERISPSISLRRMQAV